MIPAHKNIYEIDFDGNTLTEFFKNPTENKISDDNRNIFVPLFMMCSFDNNICVDELLKCNFTIKIIEDYDGLKTISIYINADEYEKNKNTYIILENNFINIKLFSGVTLLAFSVIPDVNEDIDNYIEIYIKKAKRFADTTFSKNFKDTIESKFENTNILDKFV